MRFILAWVRTFPPCESEGWTVHLSERKSRYWVECAWGKLPPGTLDVNALAGQKTNELFEQGTAKAWTWSKPARFIRWFTDGERRYGTTLWQLASVPLQAEETHPAYGRRKVWREGLEVAMKIKGSQGQRRVEWVKVEHPFTASSVRGVSSPPAHSTISPACEVHANHFGCTKQCLKTACECISATTEFVRQTGRRIATGFGCPTTDS